MLVSGLPVRYAEVMMRLTLGILLLSVIAAAPAAAKPNHWHDDGKHSNKHGKGHDVDREDRDLLEDQVGDVLG